MSAVLDTVIGVDVGTSSVRAGVFTENAKQLATASIPLKENRSVEQRGRVLATQSSEKVWEAVCSAVCLALQRAKEESTRNVKVNAIGFDATCSLVTLGEMRVEGEDDIILWYDHRAEDEAAEINCNLENKEVLARVGGVISPEMQIPKLMWLKRNVPHEKWCSFTSFYDLPDFLVSTAVGSSQRNSTRSVCSLRCKWTFDALGPQTAFDRNFLHRCGLGDLIDQGQYEKLLGVSEAENFLAPNELGSPVGVLSQDAKRRMGIDAANEVVVATSMIDAHAGALSLCKSTVRSNQCEQPPLCILSGTSACFMAQSEGRPHFVPGIWGPYDGVVQRGWFLNEGGQSAAGAAVDRVLDQFPIAIAHIKNQTKPTASVSNGVVCEFLNEHLQAMGNFQLKTKSLHILPEFNGNRSPFADPSIRGMTVGIGLDSTDTVDTLALHYLAVIQGLCYSAKEIVGQLRKFGYSDEYSTFGFVALSGGLGKNKMYCQTLADVLGMEVRVPHVDAMLQGSALAALEALHQTSNSRNSTIPESDTETSLDVFSPKCSDDALDFHIKKASVMQLMRAHQKEYATLMD